jgi:hypothetical protein
VPSFSSDSSDSPSSERPDRPNGPSPSIPATAHFVWFGAAFPWLNVLAVRSAAVRGGFDRVVLHHDSDLSATPHFRELLTTPNLELRRLDPAELFAKTDAYAAELPEIFDRLRAPATRSDLVRLAVLYAEGGVYLDLDTVTVRSLLPLMAHAEAFCGEERIVLTARIRDSKNPLTRAAMFARTQARTALRLVPGGWSAFRAIEALYPAALNNAVLGSAPRSRTVARLIEGVIELPKDRQTTLYAIGPHLLQSLRDELTPAALVVHPPTVFYPLGPEICEHWFRPARFPDRDTPVGPSTRVVHWYNSGRTRDTVPFVNPEYVRAHAARQLFSTLALPFLE